MGYLTIGVLAFTAAAAFFGMIFGLIRGRNRAILRLLLIAGSAVLAVVLKDQIVEIVMGLDLGGTNIKEIIASAFNSGDTTLPESMQNVIFALVEIILGIGVFFALFIALRIVSWLIIFPIFKIFIRKGARKGCGLGAFFGLVQGLLIAFVFCAPLNGLILQANKLAQVEIGGEKLIPIPAEIGLDEYVTSQPSNIYTITGDWLFELITSVEDENGNKVSIDDTCDVVVTVLGIADTVTELGDSMDIMTGEQSTPQERIDAMQNIGNKLAELGDNLNSMSDDAKNLVDQLVSGVKDMVGGDEETSSALESLDLENLDLAGAGRAMSGIATYIEKTDAELGNNQTVTQSDVDMIVTGIASNSFIIDMLGDESAIIEVEEEHKNMFESAIMSTSLSLEQKQVLKGLLGIE